MAVQLLRGAILPSGIAPCQSGVTPDGKVSAAGSSISTQMSVFRPFRLCRCFGVTSTRISSPRGVCSSHSTVCPSAAVRRARLRDGMWSPPGIGQRCIFFRYNKNARRPWAKRRVGGTYRRPARQSAQVNRSARRRGSALGTFDRVACYDALFVGIRFVAPVRIRKGAGDCHKPNEPQCATGGESDGVTADLHDLRRGLAVVDRDGPCPVGWIALSHASPRSVSKAHHPTADSTPRPVRRIRTRQTPARVVRLASAK